MTIFKDKIDREAKGKTLASLKKSRKIRQELITQHGSIPQSILIREGSKKAIDMLGGYGKRNKNKYTKGWEKGFRVTEHDVRAGDLSKFPQNIGETLLNFYCPKNGIWYDPFAGHNSRMQLAFENNRDYIGIDISKEFMKYNEEIKSILIKENKNKFFKSESKITLINCSSNKVNLKTNSTDFTLTSPPYWDLEYYGDESEQLGKAKTYEKFLSLITKNIKENFRILKPNSFCIWCVNDFRRKGVFHSYHSDLISIFTQLKFIHFNTYIIDLGNSIGQAFVQEILRTKIFPKRHEYVLVFKKP